MKHHRVAQSFMLKVAPQFVLPAFVWYRLESQVMLKLILVVCLSLVCAFPSVAATIDLVPVDQGRFTRRSVAGASPSEELSHDASLTTVEILESRVDAGLLRVTRYSVGYLVFSIPDLGGKALTSATLSLDWSGDSFAYRVNEFSSDPGLLQANYGPQPDSTSEAILGDLRGGPQFASSTTPGADTLLLDAAGLSAITAKSGDLFVVGLRGGHTVLPDTATLNSASLRLQTVPEPSGLAVAATVLALVVRRRRDD